MDVYSRREPTTTCPVCHREVAVIGKQIRVHARVSRKMLNAQRKRVDLLRLKLGAAEKQLQRLECWYRADR